LINSWMRASDGCCAERSIVSRVAIPRAATEAAQIRVHRDPFRLMTIVPL
jgi:hypothetical protein